jgi:hypothetical protein
MKTAAGSNFSLPKNMMIIIYMTGPSRVAGIRLEHGGRYFGLRGSHLEAVNRRPVLHREMMGCAPGIYRHHSPS